MSSVKNTFHTAKQSVHQDASDRQITREDFGAFSARVKTTLESIPIDEMDETPFHGL